MKIVYLRSHHQSSVISFTYRFQHREVLFHTDVIVASHVSLGYNLAVMVVSNQYAVGITL